MIEMNKCSNCGSKPETQSYARMHFDYFWVQCPKCHRVGPESRESYEDAKKLWNEMNINAEVA